MATKIVVHNLPELRQLRTKLRTAKLQILPFQATTIRSLANQLVVDQIHKKMRSANFDEKIITNTVLDNIEIRGKNVRLVFNSTFFSETGFDVALAREHGTKGVEMLRPRWAKVLRWVEGGIVKFSKGHKVTGMKALKIIATTLDEQEPLLQKAYSTELKKFTDKIGGLG